MKNKILALTFLGILICTAGLAQTKKTKSNKNTDHIGTWKLISQKITYENGQVLTSDSASIFLKKILTPTNFVVIVEKKIPELNNKKLAASVSGGTYSLVDGNYQEFTKYAAFDGFEKMNINYKLTVKEGKLHTIGTIGDPTIYEEVYERVDW
ncbi:MAG: hypothetical protein EOO85_15005 [Pedobacter sp.]|nr:MAG: hypothetical protein EOO85_15005 [Pedobacter sp.]